MSMIAHFHGVTDDEIKQLLAEPQAILAISRWWEPSDRPHLDIDKAWHGLHYLLYEAEPPLGDFPDLFFGGTEVGDVDVGYGPARVLTSDQVRRIAGPIEDTSLDDLQARYNPTEMSEFGIYPGVWHRDPREDDALGYLLAYFEPLKEFVLSAARDGCGLITYIC